MTNEQLVEQIRNGYSVTDNIELLYQNNLKLIRCFIRPYTAYEQEEDLLQQAYFGLWEAAQRYESDRYVKFMTYAERWIKQSVYRYIEDCGSLIRVPVNEYAKIVRYKKSIARLSKDLQRTPTDEEVAESMHLSMNDITKIKYNMHDISSLDSPLSEDPELTVVDSIQADIDVENDVIDKIYEEHSKNELWGIVERYTSTSGSNVITERYKHNKTYKQIADERGVTSGRVRQIEYDSLRKLRRGDARRELMTKFEVINNGMYRNGIGKFNEHDFTSTVEYIAIRRTEIDEKYEELMNKYHSQLALQEKR